MKTLWLLTVIVSTAVHAQPGQRALEEFCPHFPTNAPILWAVPSNSLPKSFWVYHRLPTQPFPAQLISNAVMLAELKDRGIPSPGTNGFFFTKKMPENPGPIPTLLEILPRKGTINHYQAESESAATNIPSDEVLISRAQSYASRLGVDLKQVLQQRPVSHFNLDERGFWITNQVNSRSVFFARLLDGVPFLDTEGLGGSDGFWIKFGSSGIVRSFSLVWPPLERYEQRSTASSEQITACNRRHRTGACGQ